MDSGAAFDEIRRLISDGRTDEAVSRVMALAESDVEPMDLVKCLSLLKVVDDREASEAVLRTLASNLPEDRKGRVEIAGALRGLDYPASAYSVLKGMERDDQILRLSCLCLQDMEEHELALEAVTSIASPTPFDRKLLSEVRSALGDHQEAVGIAEGLLREHPDDFDARRAYVTALIMAGREKEASKYARSCLKDKTSESNALAAYVMRVMGNTKAALGFATRAINQDHRNVSAMETLGICLAEKGEYDKARIVAGAINEVSPGDRAAINVLGYCEGHRRSLPRPRVALPAPRPAAQPHVLPEPGREHYQGRHHLETPDPHQHHQDDLYRVVHPGEVPGRAEVPEAHAAVGHG